MKPEMRIKRKVSGIKFRAKLAVTILSLVNCIGGLYLYFLVPAPGLGNLKAVFIITLVLAVSYIEAKVICEIATQKIDECNVKLESIYKFKNMSRQIDSYLEFAKWEAISNGKK